MNPVDLIHCSCGGQPVRMPPTAAELVQAADSAHFLDVDAFQCSHCGVRWTFYSPGHAPPNSHPQDAGGA